MGDNERGRPGWQPGTAHEPGGRQSSSSGEAYRRFEDRAAARLRIAWLTVHAELLHDVDDGGLLSAQLLDLRDLLEAMDAGRWAA